MSDHVQKSNEPESKTRRTEAVPGLRPDDSAAETTLASKNDRTLANQQKIVQLQRMIGNQAVSQLMAKRSTPVMAPATVKADVAEESDMESEGGIAMGEASPDFDGHSPNQRLQRVVAAVIGKKIGKTSLRNAQGKVVGKAAAGTELEVDDSRMHILPGQKKNYYLVTEASQAFKGGKAPLVDMYVEAAAVKIAAGPDAVEEDEAEEAEVAGPVDEEASLEIELFPGHTFTLTPSKAELKGEIEEEMAVDLPTFEFAVDFPIPAAPGVYIEAGIGITPKFALTLAGSYAVTKVPNQVSVAIDGSATAEASLSLEAKAGAGVGVANIVGLSAGLFAEAKVGAELAGTFSGTVVRDGRKAWTSTTLKLGLKGEAAIKAAVGAYLKAKLLSANITKKYTIAEKELAKWEFEREAKVEKAGVKLADFKPRLSDIKVNEQPDLQEVSDTTPLLSGGRRSDE